MKSEFLHLWIQNSNQTELLWFGPIGDTDSILDSYFVFEMFSNELAIFQESPFKERLYLAMNHFQLSNWSYKITVWFVLLSSIHWNKWVTLCSHQLPQKRLDLGCNDHINIKEELLHHSYLYKTLSNPKYSQKHYFPLILANANCASHFDNQVLAFTYCVWDWNIWNILNPIFTWIEIPHFATGLTDVHLAWDCKLVILVIEDVSLLSHLFV